MKLLVHTRFHPNIGGVETVARLLAYQWHEAGVQLTIATDVRRAPDDSDSQFPFPVVRRPSPLRLLRLVAECDVYLQNNLSLKTLWPAFLFRKRFVACHHAFYWTKRVGHRAWRERLKRFISRYSANIAVSAAIAESLPPGCATIPNPYDDQIFHAQASIVRDRELVFVGRLVSEKGILLLLQAIERLRCENLFPRLTIVGSGPERAATLARVEELQLKKQVEFAGSLSPQGVAKVLRRHQILILPTMTVESFGVAALEAIACGCVAIGSDAGGLPEAIGPCGVTFQPRDVAGLTRELANLLTKPEKLDAFRAAAPEHLAKHQPKNIATRYLGIMEERIRRGGLMP
jgi:glycogen(starch) synthase